MLGRPQRGGEARPAAALPPERSLRATASTRRCPRSLPPRAPASAASTASSPPSATCWRRSWSSACRRPRSAPTPRSRARRAHGRRSPGCCGRWPSARPPTTCWARRWRPSPSIRRSWLRSSARPTALECLLAAARAEGRLRADATTLDLRLLFAATRAAGQLQSGAWRRMLELGIDALDTQATDERQRP